MIGGGFMKHASDTNKSDRNQKNVRKFKHERVKHEVFNKSNSNEKLYLNNIPEEKVKLERELLKEKFRIQKKENWIIFFSLIVMLILLSFIVIFILY